jgi:hypothetical protein
MAAQFRSMQLHIGYLRSLEDSERVRAGCVQYLQNWLINFYPERLDIVKEAQRLASDLGGALQVPRVSWKYAWIRALFGWGPAKRAQVLVPRIRWSFVRAWDSALFHAQSRWRLTHRDARSGRPGAPRNYNTSRRFCGSAR